MLPLPARRDACQSLPAAQAAERESRQPSPAVRDIPLATVNRVLVTIYLLGKEGQRILSGDLCVGGVQPKGWLRAAAY